jgi:hypothetical protein
LNNEHPLGSPGGFVFLRGSYFLIKDNFLSLRQPLISDSRCLASRNVLNFSEYFNFTGRRIFV